MPDRSVTAVLKANVSQFTAGISSASASARSLGSELQSNAAKNQQGFNQLGTAVGAFGLALAAGVASSVLSFANFDESMSHVQAATHETAANMDLLRGAAIDAGQATAFSATEAASGIEELAKAGLTTADVIGGGLTGALNLAAAGGLEVAEAAETTATALSVFGLEGEQASHVADLLAAGAGKAQGSVHDMGGALNQSALLANQMGLSVEQTTGVLAEFASAGLIGSDAGTAFRNMLLHLSNPSTEAAATMKQLGIAVYDSTGTFVGMESVAGQLQSRMGDLDGATRDAAMATIFGADAVRAAGILFEDGSAGVAEWADKVNDAGFAAETAALRMDNLKGDLEKLSGSVETALIGLGEAADAPLRGIVQNLTNVVNAFAGLPSGVQTATLGIGAVTAAVTLFGAAALVLIPKIRATQLALEAMSVTARGATLALGGVAAVLTVGAIIIGKYAQAQADATARAEEFGASLDTQTGAVTGNTRAWALNEITTSGALDAASALGISAETLTAAYLGNSAAIDQVNIALDKARGGQTDFTGGSMAAAEAVGTVEDAMSEGAQAADDYAEANHTVRDHLLDVADATRFGVNPALRSNRTEIEGVTGAYSDVSPAAIDAMESQVDAAAEAEDALQPLVDKLALLIEDYETINGITRSAAESQGAYFESIRDTAGLVGELTEAVDENGAAIDTSNMSLADIIATYGGLEGVLNATGDGFDVATEGGYALQKSFDAQAESAEKSAQAAYDLAVEQAKGDPSALVAAYDTYTGTLDTNRASLSLQLQALGIGKEKADDFALSILGIPEPAPAELVVLDEEAKAKIAAHDYAITHLPSEWQTKLQALDDGATAVADEVARHIYAVPTSRTTHFYSVDHEAGQSYGGITRARGGRVGGFSPSDTADNIPMWATAGEYVLNAGAVRGLDAAFGPSFLERLNQGSLALDRMVAFPSGMSGRSGGDGVTHGGDQHIEINVTYEKGTDPIDAVDRAWRNYAATGMRR